MTVRARTVRSSALLGAVVSAAGLACSGWLGEDVERAYQEARTAALAPAGPVPAGWTGDTALTVSYGAIGSAAGAALESFRPEATRVDSPLGQISLTPTLSMSGVTARAGSCDGCLDLDVRVKGEARWAIGPTSGRVPYQADTTARVVVTVVEDAAGHHLDADVTRIFRTSVDVGAARGLRVDLGPVIEDWLTRALVQQAPAVRLVTLERDALPLRAVRLAQSDQGVTLFGLTDTPGTVDLPAPPSAGPGGMTFALSEAALCALARRKAFATVTDLVPEALAFRLTGNRFTLELRLWSLQPPAFWRDYTATGGISVEGATLQVETREVTAGAGSVGAQVVDVAAALAGTDITSEIQGALSASVALPEAASLGLRFSIDGLEGQPGMILIRGSITR